MNINQETKPIYLDYNATTPLHPSVCSEIKKALSEGKMTGIFGNPSSNHFYGRKSKGALDGARENLSILLDSNPNNIFFVSCGTEANNMAINGAIEIWRKFNPLVIPTVLTTQLEHPGTLRFLESKLMKKEVNVSMLEVDETGKIDIDDFKKTLSESKNVCLITLMHANNEIGTVNEISKLFEHVKNVRELEPKNKLFPLTHVDCAQSIGKIPVSFKYLNCDLMSVVGHKFYAPKGVGAIVINDPEEFPPLLFGGSQEQGKRPGTENILLDIAIGEAARICVKNANMWAVKSAKLVERLYNNIKQGIETRYEEAAERIIKVNGAVSKLLKENKLAQSVEKHFTNGDYDKFVGALPNTLSISFMGLDARKVVYDIGDSVCISTGSACHSACETTSSILKALGLDETMAQGTLRISVGAFSTEEEVDTASRILVAHIVKNIGGSNFL